MRSLRSCVGNFLDIPRGPARSSHHATAWLEWGPVGSSVAPDNPFCDAGGPSFSMLHLFVRSRQIQMNLILKNVF